MKAMIVAQREPIESAPLRFADVEKPAPQAGELLVRVSVCGVCRTDLHVVEGDLPPKKSPVVPGHQVVGVVEARGESCYRFASGDRVGIAWLRHTCGSCRYCVSGSENLCDASLYTGYHADGGYAEYAIVPEAFAYPIPAGYSDEEAAPLLCAGIIGYRALKRSGLPPAGKLGIFGFGSSAHIVMQIALKRGSEVFVITRDEKHRKLAKELGASHASENIDSLPARLDSAIVFAPAGEVVPPALRALDKGGTVALAGIHMSPVPSMTYEEHLFHEKRLVSVESNTRADGEELMEEAARLRIVPRVTTFDWRLAGDVLLQLKRDEISGSAVLKIRER